MQSTGQKEARPVIPLEKATKSQKREAAGIGIQTSDPSIKVYDDAKDIKGKLHWPHLKVSSYEMRRARLGLRRCRQIEFMRFEGLGQAMGCHRMTQ